MSFSELLKERFARAGEDAVTALARRTRIDARTVGYPVEGNTGTVIWMGMSPTGEETGDLWRLVEVSEEANEYLIQVNEDERLVEFRYTDEEPMPFDKAVEALAIWEQARMMKGFRPAAGHEADKIGSHYFREIAMRRGFLASATGDVTGAPGIFPGRSGKFLRSDLEAMREHRARLQGGDVLGDLFRAQDALRVTNDISIDEDIAAFGEIGLFEQMEFFAKILVEYARIKVDYIESFYSNPAKINREGLYDRLNAYKAFFNDNLYERYNQLRGELALYLFRYFEVDEADWDKVIDLEDRKLKVEMLKNPGAKATHDMVTKVVSGPLDEAEVEALLTVSARALLYFRAQLKDSAQKDLLERKGIYRQSGIADLLNFLDLLEIKYGYAELAKISTTLRETEDHRRLKEQTERLRRRVEDFKANLKESGSFSAAQEAQIEEFIKASSPVHLIKGALELPGQIAAAVEFISRRIRPQAQLSLPLDYTQKGPIAAPTRRAYEQAKEAPQPG